jgi:hypothetical protein
LTVRLNLYFAHTFDFVIHFLVNLIDIIFCIFTVAENDCFSRKPQQILEIPTPFEWQSQELFSLILRPGRLEGQKNPLSTLFSAFHLKKTKNKNSSSQFHQHFISTFAPTSMSKNSLTYTSSTKKTFRKTFERKSLV